MQDTPLTLSPELDSPYEVAAGNLEALIEWANNNEFESGRNEATTRLHLINKLIEECLLWPAEQIRAEVAKHGDYVDYELGQPATRLVIEAKREGVSFELPPGFDSRSIKLPLLRQLSPEVGRAIDQALGYCLNRGVPLGAVANGHQLVAFIGSRQDGVSPSEGRAIVFTSLADMRASFPDLWSYLSPHGIESQALYAHLQRSTQPPPPEKLASHINNYPRSRRRNQLQAELKILGGLFLEDIAANPVREREFLKEAYCASGELSEYALISKDILQARYNAFFSDASDVTEHPASSRTGVTSELTADVVAASLSRRPIILLGDVGVGKTMFIRRLIVVEAPELFESSVTLYVDFGNEPALATEIEAFVRRSLISQLRESHGIDIYENDFVRGVYNGEIERFARGIYGSLRTDEPEEYRRRELEMLERHISSDEAHLKASLGYIARAQRRQAVIFLDNVDQRQFSFQEQVFLIAQSFASTWPGTVFVSLRPETFYRSRSHGSLAAYQPRVFTIAPPRVDRVLKKRLEFARDQLRDEGTLDVLGAGVRFESHTLDAYIGAILFSLTTNRELTELIDNLSGGNVRLALGFLTEFVGSGHVDSEKIVRIMEESNRYRIPVHEFLRALIFGDHEYFDPVSSPIANVFDVSVPDAKEHFLLPLLVEFVDRAGDVPGSEGFVAIEDIFNEGQRLGFLPSQIDVALERAVEKRLLEPSLRGLLQGAIDRYRITTIGAYTVTRLLRLFTYVDAMTVDTPIVDAEMRAVITDAWTIPERLGRTETFRRYLDGAWSLVDGAGAAFDWGLASAELGKDIEHIARRIGVSID